MLARKFLFPHVIEMNYQAGRPLGVNVYLIDGGDEWLLIDIGYEETAETSPEIMRDVARRTLEEGKRVFPALRSLGERDIKNAWSGRVYYTLDDYPFVERRHGGHALCANAADRYEPCTDAAP